MRAVATTVSLSLCLAVSRSLFADPIQLSQDALLERWNQNLKDDRYGAKLFASRAQDLQSRLEVLEKQRKEFSEKLGKALEKTEQDAKRTEVDLFKQASETITGDGLDAMRAVPGLTARLDAINTIANAPFEGAEYVLEIDAAKKDLRDAEASVRVYEQAIAQANEQIGKITSDLNYRINHATWIEQLIMLLKQKEMEREERAAQAAANAAAAAAAPHAPPELGRGGERGGHERPDLERARAPERAPERAPDHTPSHERAHERAPERGISVRRM